MNGTDVGESDEEVMVCCRSLLVFFLASRKKDINVRDIEMK